MFYVRRAVRILRLFLPNWMYAYLYKDCDIDSVMYIKHMTHMFYNLKLYAIQSSFLCEFLAFRFIFEKETTQK
jgi:hypothetical protein